MVFWKGKEDIVERGIIREKIKERFYNKELINKREFPEQNEVENIVQVMSFIYDINFGASFEIIQKENYINKIIDRFNFKILETQKDLEKIRKIANQYIEEKTK